MQKQKFLKLSVLMLAILLLDVPKAFAAKHRKQGSATTRAPPPPQPAQAPNQDASKLSYGNQGPPPAYHNPSPPQGGYNHNQPPPPYQQNAGHPQQPYQGQPQPVIINHVQQPQSGGGGLGTAGGLAVGALAGAAGGYAISQALSDDDKKEETTASTTAATTVSGATTTTTAATTVSSASSVSESTTLATTIIAVNETANFVSNSTLNETSTVGNSSLSATILPVGVTTLPVSTPVEEALIEQKNTTAVNQALSSDGVATKISLNIVLLSSIYHFIF